MSKDDFKENDNSKHARNRRSHNEDDCQEKACSDATSNFNNWLKNRPKKEDDPQCPVDRDTLGRNTWSLLHTMAAKYPMRPTAEEKANMREFIRLLSILYPCTYCATEFRQDIKEMPPRLESRKALSLWFCQVHNKVNEKLNKPQFDCSKIDERWRTGWKDGSCM